MYKWFLWHVSRPNVWLLPSSITILYLWLLIERETVTKDNWLLANSLKPYSSSRVYKLLSTFETAPAPMRWIWKSCSPLKHKIFFRVLLQDRQIAEIFSPEKNFHVESSSCVICTKNANEDYIDLFFSCDFNQNFWWKLNMEWNVDLHIYQMIQEAREKI
jgi:hypothetical protein